MQIHLTSLSFVLLLLLVKPCPALSQQVIFNKVVSPIGSFSNFVGGIAQDKNGYMWFATSSGLYKYDGYKFKLYTHDPTNTNSISETHLETLYADRKGIIWIATWINGLDRLDPITNTFTHFGHNPDNPESLSNDTIRSILEDRDGILWLGTSGGLDKYDPETGKFKNYHHDPDNPYSLSCNHVRKLYEDKQGTIWVGTGSVWAGEGGETDEGGLNRFDKKTGRFVRYLHDPNNPHSLINNKIQAICEDSRGIFWVGTTGDGLHTMDRATGTFKRHLYDPAHPEKLSRPPIITGVNPDQITFISEDASGNIWIGTLGNGLNKYDPKTQKTTHYTHRDSASGFTDNSGWCFCNSKDNIFWIGTYEGGLYRLDPYHKNIAHVLTNNSVFAFNEDSLNNFWVGSVEGLSYQNRNRGTSKKFVYEPLHSTSLSSDGVISLHRDKETLWIGTNNGLNRFNAQTNSFTRYLNDPKDSNTISAGGVLVIKDAGNDFLWVGTFNGLDLMNKRKGSFTHFKNNSKDSNSLSSNFVPALLGDKSGDLWVGTYNGGGLNYFNHTTRIFSHFLKEVSVTSLVQDSSGTIWVGTDLGLYKKDNLHAGFVKFTGTFGDLETASVLSIQEDDHHNIWVSTSTGIFKIDTRSNQSTAFNAQYGVNASNLNVIAGYKGRNGEIYFGDAHGYYFFSPDELTGNHKPPQVLLTNFSVGGKPVLPGKSSPLDSEIENAKNISLGYNQNVFSFEFAGIHYSNPENNHHLYMLENYDQAWHEAGFEKTASYFNVPPGKYIFHVKVVSSDGIEAEKTIAIVISPPWWRSWWAYCIYGLLFIAAAISIHRYQKNRLLKAERERTRTKELAQAKEIEKAYRELKTTQSQLIQQEKMASLGELTAGIAHEIQNPLNFVNNFSEVNSELIAEMKQEIDKGNLVDAKALANNIDENEQKIIFHGKRADSIVKGMLQHSRSRNDIKESTNINALADEYFRLAYHGLRAKNNSFNATMKRDYDESIGNINIIPQDIGRVILNLINNAFYVVDEKKKAPQSASGGGAEYEPTVTVSTKKFGDKVLISVKDNGNGIPQKALDKIFQPFFTTKPTGQGTGLGLSLSYDIIKAHGGEIKVETREDQGTAFTIILPFSN